MQNVDTERIGEMFTDNVLHLFSTEESNLAVHYPHVVTTALFNILMALFKNW